MRSSFFRKNIEEMQGYTPGEQPRDTGLIKLNTNENPYPPSPAVAEVLRSFPYDSLRRYPDPLAQPAREAIAGVFRVSPECVLCGNGSDDLLTIVTRAFVDQGDTVVSFQPGYLLYETLAQIQGAVFRTIPFDSNWQVPLDPELYRDASLVFLANPNSPSGTLVAREKVVELADMLPCPLIVDEAYADFAGETCADLPQQVPNVVVIRTLSKSYSLAGIRFGYLIARPEIAEGLIKVKDSYNCDAVSIAAAQAAIRDQAHMQENVRRICRTRDRVYLALKELGFDMPPSKANFLWCAGGPISPDDLYTGLRRRGILVRLLDYGPLGRGVRITIGTDTEMDRLLEAIRDLLAERGNE